MYIILLFHREIYINIDLIIECFKKIENMKKRIWILLFNELTIFFFIIIIIDLIDIGDFG